MAETAEVATASASAPATSSGASPAEDRGVGLVAGADGKVLGFEISAAAQVYGMVDRIIGDRRVYALPVADRYAVAGKIAAVPAEHARLAEHLVAAFASADSEAGALNALYVLELCKELVPAFKAQVREERWAEAAERCGHERAKAAVLRREWPEEWERAKAAAPAPRLVLLPQEVTQADSGADEGGDSDGGLVTEAGRAVTGATRLLGGATLGGVGLVTDRLGLTAGAEDALAERAEGAVDTVGGGVHAVASAVDRGIQGTADDIARRGLGGAVGDGLADAVDIVSGLVEDGVTGIADGVGSLLDWATGRQEEPRRGASVQRLVVTVGELLGEERSLGLRLESRIITKFTKPEAERFGFHLGDTILAVGVREVNSQEEMLEAIAEAKSELQSQGLPVRFLVERLVEPLSQQ